MARCPKCLTEYSRYEDNFYFRKDSGKYRTKCITCVKKENYDKKQEKWDKHKESSREYYWNNRDKILSNLDLEERRKYNREYSKENRDYLAIKRHERYSRLNGVNFAFTLEEWVEAQKRFHMRCAYCGGESGDEEITIDHFVPYSKKGETVVHNILPSCGRCNRHKSSRDFTEWYLEWKFYSPKRMANIFKYLNEMETIK